MSKQLFKVFVYGTLKRGEPNHKVFSEAQNGYFKYLCDAKTLEKYPLVIASSCYIPFLLKKQGKYEILIIQCKLLCKYNLGAGNYVQGEIYEVDQAVLEKLDILEDHPNFYVREEIEVKPSNGREHIKVWIYFLSTFKQELLLLPTYESYSSNGSHGLQYIDRYKRPPSFSAKMEV